MSEPISGTPEVAKTQTPFVDWTVECLAVCKLAPAATSSQGDPKQFKIVITSHSPDNTSYAVMSVPSGVYLAPGIVIRVDDKHPFKALFEICDETACHAGFKLTGSVLRAFKLGQIANIRVWLRKDQIVDFPISLYGFTRAYSYLQEQGTH
ncbi:invasion associated locus B family protein [Pseudovibrio sp. WM33]|uniref:invasion associated locus B family protein n=1 Tax=Pseudovibrio sp. WM33 TaxID=1735585 RepID=UPI00187D24DB|nr:invasion associated locus B family protein [Pseudovibrio sp. WM33]